jgi:putative transposase
MPQSLDQVYLHTIFSTKDLFPFFQTPESQRDLHAYLAAVCNQLDCKALRIGGVSDHVHLLTRLPRTVAIADFVKESKRVSSLWVQQRDEVWKKFSWQAGYGVFSVSASKVPEVENYISHQSEHHRKRSFQDEYREFLSRHGVDFDERYVWD